MLRLTLLVACGVSSVAHADLIEYRLWGEGLFTWNSTAPLTGSDQGRWTEQIGYDMRFIADTDNVVADGLGGYSVAVDFADLTLDGRAATLMPQTMLRVDADGMLSFFSTRYNRSWMTISSEALGGFDLATSVEPLIQQLGLDPNGDAQNWWQDASFANIEFLSTEGGRGFGTLDVMNFSVTRGVPAPGAMALLGLGGLAASRRRR